MNIARAPHRWQVTPKQAIAIQARLAADVDTTCSLAQSRFVAGADMAFTRDGEHCIAGVVLWDTRDECVIESHLARKPVRFPYVPGLLSFREAPTVLAALRKLRKTPDVLMCDGQGLAHPRRLGLACHIGIITELPTIGVAKSRLIGTHGALRVKRGSVTDLRDGDEVIGRLLRTRDGVRPVYVSVGHRVRLEDAVSLVLNCATRFRLPEPTRLADRLVADARKQS